MNRRILSIFLLMVFGVIRMPFENHLEREGQSMEVRAGKLTLGLREQVSQLAFVAALSGFRSLVASYLWIEAHIAWERTEWGRMAGLFNTVTTLQPKSLLYWDMAAWHMAWNASVAALDNPKEPSEALRIRAQRQYFQLGREILEAGIHNNPNRAMLYERLGILLRDKFDDHCGAAKAFEKAASFPDATPYIARFSAYEMAQCPGREKEAYVLLKKLYLSGESQRLPTLITKLREMEETLDIPAQERIAPQPIEEEEKAHTEEHGTEPSS